MSLSILISYSESPAIIVGGSHAMIPLVSDVAEHMKASHPKIYAAAFEQLEWGGDVDLSELDKTDFAIVYDASRKSYEDFLGSMPRAEIESKASGILHMWKEYLAAMEADPRLAAGGS